MMAFHVWVSLNSYCSLSWTFLYVDINLQTLMNVLKILMAVLRHAQTQLEATTALVALVMT